jgi:hypothetical protein
VDMSDCTRLTSLLILLQDKLIRTDKRSEEYEARHQLAVRTITHLKNGIHSIFTRIGHDAMCIVSHCRQ